MAGEKQPRFFSAGQPCVARPSARWGRLPAWGAAPFPPRGPPKGVWGGPSLRWGGGGGGWGLARGAGGERGAATRRSGGAGAGRAPRSTPRWTRRATVDTLGNPTGFHLTGGQASDLAGADALLPGVAAPTLIAEKGYDAEVRVLAPLREAG